MPTSRELNELYEASHKLKLVTKERDALKLSNSELIELLTEVISKTEKYVSANLYFGLFEKARAAISRATGEAK